MARSRTLYALSTALTLVAACSAPGSEAVETNPEALSTPFPNDKPAYDYFVQKGLTNFQAAAVVGNLDQESGVNPTISQYGGGPGRGIAQWSAGGRWDTTKGDNLVAYAAMQGMPTSSLTVQLGFIWYELETFQEYGLAKLRATTNVTDATAGVRGQLRRVCLPQLPRLQSAPAGHVRQERARRLRFRSGPDRGRGHPRRSCHQRMGRQAATALPPRRGRPQTTAR